VDDISVVAEVTVTPSTRSRHSGKTRATSYPGNV